MSDWHIIITGNPADGFKYYGPFESLSAADDAAGEDENIYNDNWFYVKLQEPDNESYHDQSFLNPAISPSVPQNPDNQMDDDDWEQRLKDAQEASASEIFRWASEGKEE